MSSPLPNSSVEGFWLTVAFPINVAVFAVVEFSFKLLM